MWTYSEVTPAAGMHVSRNQSRGENQMTGLYMEHCMCPPAFPRLTLDSCRLIIPLNNSLKKVLHLVPITFGSMNIEDWMLNTGKLR